jgi:hypothetical protein
MVSAGLFDTCITQYFLDLKKSFYVFCGDINYSLGCFKSDF